MLGDSLKRQIESIMYDGGKCRRCRTMANDGEPFLLNQYSYTGDGGIAESRGHVEAIYMTLRSILQSGLQTQTCA